MIWKHTMGLIQPRFCEKNQVKSGGTWAVMQMDTCPASLTHSYPKRCSEPAIIAIPENATLWTTNPYWHKYKRKLAVETGKRISRSPFTPACSLRPIRDDGLCCNYDRMVTHTGSNSQSFKLGIWWINCIIISMLETQKVHQHLVYLNFAKIYKISFRVSATLNFFISLHQYVSPAASDSRFNAFLLHLWCINIGFPHSQRKLKCAPCSYFSYKTPAHHGASLLSAVRAGPVLHILI